ncbi:MAG: damage-inducible protein CinA, partial [Chitinophagaceae bacterium]
MAVSNVEKIIEDLRKILTAKKQTVSVAESVTSGSLQTAFSLGEGASLFFMGGITVYNVVQKYLHLDVDISDAVASNCVSVEVSSQMAEAACRMFSSTWAIGITGYSTPMPPHTDNGLFACYAIALNGK